MPFEIHRDTEDNICRIEYSPTLTLMAFQALGRAINAVALLVFSIGIFLYLGDVRTSVPLVQVVLVGVAFLFAIPASIMRMGKYMQWFRNRPHFVFEKETLRCEDRGGRQLEFRWEELERITPLHSHLVFKSGARVAFPPEFWQKCYNREDFEALLGFSLASKVKARIFGFELETTTKILGLELGRMTKFGP